MSSSSNPSHMLMNRNPPLPAHPQLVPQSTSRHSNSNHSRQASAPYLSSEEAVYLYPVPETTVFPTSLEAGSIEEEERQSNGEMEVEVHPTFARDSAMRGKVKVVVGRNEFWCHKEILWFASPFFQGLLQGSWAENTHHIPVLRGRSPSPTGTDTDTTNDHSASTGEIQDTSDTIEEEEIAEMERGAQSRKGSVYLDAVSDPAEPTGPPSLGEIMRELREMPGLANEPNEIAPALASQAQSPQVNLLPASAAPSSPSARAPPTRTLRHSFSSSTIPSSINRPALQLNEDVEAVVELHEESAAAFQDFLFWAYPHLDCRVSWTNVEALVALSTKLLVPALQSICYHFLLSHASGKPIVALALAEDYGHADLYREASRFVLDQPSWDRDEMEILSSETQLKLSQRRNWFLERLLKLGSIDVKKAYQCRADCPDPAKCQALIHDKWHQANLAVCRYGPPQPSVAFRCIRQLETLPTNPSLVMPHPLCQMAAKTWVKDRVYDRMFQFRLINSPLSPGTEKYWLAITLH